LPIIADNTSIIEAMKKYLSFIITLIFPVLLILCFLFSACKSNPAPTGSDAVSNTIPAGPSASLVFAGIEAEDPTHLSLFFKLEVVDPRPSASRAVVESWRAEMEGQDAGSAFTFDCPMECQGNSSYTIPIRLDMDTTALAAMGLAPRDDYNVTLVTVLDFASNGTTVLTHDLTLEVSCTAGFPGIRAPKFSIGDIAILKAELINTRFRVRLKIENPNLFPIELSDFNYRLYGEGRFWADGSERKRLKVEGKSALEGDVILVMNFIDMERSLLDQIIKLVDVNYRFAGGAQVYTGVEYLPVFDTSFSLSGYSEVLER